MTVPSDAVKLVEGWCDVHVPPDFRERARLEATVTGNKVTIFECTRMPDGEWVRVPSAQLRFDQRTQIWTLHWIDSDSKWHIVQAMPTLVLEELLEEIADDPDCLFFG